MSYDRTLFHNLQPHEGSVRCANGEQIQATGIGKVLFQYQLEKESLTGALEGVLYVPALSVNLVSMGALLEEGNVQVEHANGELLLRRRGCIFAAAKSSGRAYRMRGTPIAVEASRCARVGDTSIEVWHKRLGHPSVDRLHILVDRHLVHGITIDQRDMPACTACHAGKQSRRPFAQQATRRAKRVLELVHSDVSGPHQQTNLLDARYYVSFTDDYSRYGMMVLMRHRSEVLNCFKRFKAHAEAATGQRLMSLRSDNGGEYISTEFRQYCLDNGIEQQTTIPYCPQQNGVAERLNRTLFNSARAMLADCSMPHSFWGPAVLTASYVCNRLPSTAIANKTPFELWTGEIADISHLRVFGCVCYVHVPAQLRTKLDARSRKCVFMGYHTHGFRVYNPQTEKYYIPRDVDFDKGKSAAVDARSHHPGPQPGDQPGFLEPVIGTGRAAAPGQGRDNGPLTGVPAGVSEGAGSPTHLAPTPGRGSGRPTSPQLSPAGGTPGPVPISPRGERLTPRSTAEEFQSPVEDVEAGGSLPAPPSEEHGGRPPTPPEQDASPELRRSTRSRVAPVRLSYGAVDDRRDPATYQDAVRGAAAADWQLACEEEMQAHADNGSWELVDLPAGAKPLSSRWVLTRKCNARGVVVRHKARMVARGFNQRPGLDYEETYAPTLQMGSFRTILALAAAFDWEAEQLDNKTAFLHGDLDKVVYMQQPEGFVDARRPHLVCLLKKAIYGLKQAARQWHQKLTAVLKKAGCKRSICDEAVYQ